MDGENKETLRGLAPAVARLLALVLGWAALSLLYAFFVLVLLGILFGREGTPNHLIGLSIGLVTWIAVTFVAIRASRKLRRADT